MQNEGMSPYQAPEEAEVLKNEVKAISAIPKVMGILHIVFGSISLLMALKQLIVPTSQVEQLEAQLGAQGQEVVISEESLNAMEAMEGVVTLSSFVNFGGALALLLAGIGLVKYRTWGRLLSNVYVFFSFVGKIIAGYIFLGPMSQLMSEIIEMQPDLEGVDGETLKAVIIGGMVVMLCVMSVYMIVTLILVNKKSAKNSLS